MTLPHYQEIADAMAKDHSKFPRKFVSFEASMKARQDKATRGSKLVQLACSVVLGLLVIVAVHHYSTIGVFQ